MSENIPDTLYCANHPDRPTGLRCNRCEKPICTSCAILTPTGYRCKECVRGQQKVFDTARPLDPLIAAAIAAPLSLGGSYIASFMGFFTIFIAPIAGMLISEAVRWAVKRRRSRLLFLVAAGAALLGALVFPLIRLLYMLTAVAGGFASLGLYSLLGLVWYGVYAFLVTSTVYYRLSGIQISR
jgi:MFS family permease